MNAYAPFDLGESNLVDFPDTNQDIAYSVFNRCPNTSSAEFDKCAFDGSSGFLGTGGQYQPPAKNYYSAERPRVTRDGSMGIMDYYNPNDELSYQLYMGNTAPKTRWEGAYKEYDPVSPYTYTPTTKQPNRSYDNSDLTLPWEQSYHVGQPMTKNKDDLGNTQGRCMVYEQRLKQPIEPAIIIGGCIALSKRFIVIFLIVAYSIGIILATRFFVQKAAIRSSEKRKVSFQSIEE